MKKTVPLTPTAVELQRSIAQAIMRPLVDDSINHHWVDGSNMSDFAARFIKPNDKLSSVERLEIYNQQYWYRLLDSLREDFPGLHAVLGEDRFVELSVAYLDKYASNSFTLRNLGSRLYQFAREDFGLFSAKEKGLILDMIIFEWSEIEAFDGSRKEPLDGKALEGCSASQIMLELQPHMSVLALEYAVDEFLLNMKKSSHERTLVSATGGREIKNVRRKRPKKENIFVVIHRQGNTVYYKRIDRVGYMVLSAIKSGACLKDACALAGEQLTGSSVNITATVEKLQNDFSTWVKLGWFCR
jgi:hypothetical protein